jgi:hypothetical protein
LVHAAIVTGLVLGSAWAQGSTKPDLEVTVTTTGVVKAAGGERLGFVRGSALAFEGELDRYEVVFLVDVSGSTAEPSGADIDGDGSTASKTASFGRRLLRLLPIPTPRSRGGGDSILAAEVAAVRALLKKLDARTTRAALVSFSGAATASADNATVEVPLTSEFGRVREGLDLMFGAGPEGATDMQAGLRAARGELSRVFIARSSAKKRPQQYVVLLTDGVPDVPYESAEQSERRAVQMAKRMGAEGMHVYVFALGPGATQRPRAAVQIAQASRGEFRTVEKPGDLPALLPELRFASIEEVRVVPLDVPSPPLDVSRSEDGDYSALVPLRKGENRVEVYARASDGREKRVTATISAEEPLLSDDQRTELQRLLEITAMKQGREPPRDRNIEIESQEAKPKP